jgi:hypothetical protein
VSCTRKCNFLFSHIGYVPRTVVLYAVSVSMLMLVACTFKAEQVNKVLKCVTCEGGGDGVDTCSRLGLG